MSANTLDTSTYNTVAANTVDDAVLNAAAILAWRQNVKAVVDQHASEIDQRLPLSGGTLTGRVNMEHVAPRYKFYETDGSADNKAWDILVSVEQFLLRLANDADTTATTFMQVDRTGMTVDTINFPNGTFQIKGVSVAVGSGSPEGAVTAPVGSLYLRSDGGTSTTLYVKQSGTGNTGWVAK